MEEVALAAFKATLYIVVGLNVKCKRSLYFLQMAARINCPEFPFVTVSFIFFCLEEVNVSHLRGFPGSK